MRANTNITQKARYKLQLGSFRGVDLSTSPLRVDPSRASFMKNMICENGVNHKRPGWREEVKLEGKVNGIFPFKEDAQDVMLVHAGVRIYRVTCREGRWHADDITGELVLSDRSSQCFCRDGRAFLVGCGDYLVYGPKDMEATPNEYVLQRVRDIAYVPTTTMAILSVFEENNSNIVRSGASLDAVNLLTPIRKNTLKLTNNFDNEWYLDGTPDDGSRISVELEGFHGAGARIHVVFSGTVDHLADSWLEEELLEGEDLFGDAGMIFNTEEFIRIRVLEDGFYGQEKKCSVYFKFSVSGMSSITVTYSCTTKGYEEKIKQCTFGALFGVDGANDRLFLSGNPDEIGMDRWSETGDVTYFPDGNGMFVGGSEAPITGYARLSDSTLAIFKEQMSGYPTIYYRTGKTTSIVDADGVTVPVDYFPVVAGTVGEGLVNQTSVVNFAGDPLILSPNGVFGIELSANISSGERYAKERSRAIYKELCGRDLSQAVACVYRGRYYLSLGDGSCYVADSRYKTTFDGSADMGYEWWMWDNVPATAFAVQKDALWFGDREGRLCRFQEGVFSDMTRAEIKDFEMWPKDDGVLCFGTLSPHAGDELIFGSDLYALLLDRAEITDGERISFPVEMLHVIRDGQTVYADAVGASGLEVDVPYTVCDVDPISLTFRICDEVGDAVSVRDGAFRLCVNLKGEKCYVGDVENNELVLCGADGRALKIIAYDGIKSSHLVGEMTSGAPVVARWRTPVMDFGTASAQKSLLCITVTHEPGVQGTVKFLMETRLAELELLKHGDKAFTLNGLDLADFSFSTGFAESCRKRLNVRNFNYAVFEFISDTASDVAVNSIELEYKINQVSRGVH